MRGMKLSPWKLLIAFVVACVISVPAFSGEHPWDSDNNKNGSNGGASGGSDTSTSTPVVLRSASHGGSLLQSACSPMSLLFTASYFAAEKLYAKMYDAGAKSTRQMKTVGR